MSYEFHRLDHRCRGSTGPPCSGALRLATNLVDVPAEIIAILY
jgi:hypothetical protein